MEKEIMVECPHCEELFLEDEMLEYEAFNGKTYHVCPYCQCELGEK